MATFTASARQSSVIKAPHTGVQAINARWSICGTGTASSVVLLVRVPNGATILDYMLYADSAGANQTVQVGTSATPSGLGAAVSLTAGTTHRGLNGLTALLPYRVSLSDDAHTPVGMGAGRVRSCDLGFIARQLHAVLHDGRRLRSPGLERGLRPPFHLSPSRRRRLGLAQAEAMRLLRAGYDMQIVNARERLARAQRLHQGLGSPKDLDAAESIYNEILNKNIGNPQVLYCLGTLYMERGFLGLSIQILSQVTNLAPDFGEAWNNLGMAFRGEHMLDAADQAFEQAERCLPRIADIPSNRAGIRINAGAPEDALAHAGRALDIDPAHNQARFHKALALLELQRWNEAWEAHEARLGVEKGPAESSIAERNYHTNGATTPWWDGKTKARVVIHGEEGLGDEIMFASCIADANKTGSELIIEPNPRLHALFERSFPDCKVHGTHATDGGEWTAKWGRPDYQDGSSGRNKHEQGANSARHGLLRGAGADELAHQQR